MKEKERFLIWLSQFDLTLKKIDGLLEIMDDNISIDAFLKLKGGDKVFNFQTLEDMRDKASVINREAYFSGLERIGVKVVTIFSDEYPKKLKDLPDAPKYLFYKGDFSLLEKPSISMVGTRNPNNYGKLVSDKFAEELARSGLVIISGLAYGIDSIAHRKALEVGGKTIAILGGGFNKIYPSDHTSLANEIAEKGLLLSEYSPNLNATKYTFPQRNRIIAGLGDGVLITQAGSGSGTVHTKDFAIDYGKNVYSVPGEINNKMCTLTNDIIKCGQGACVTEVEDILKDYSLKAEKQIKQSASCSEEQIILDQLEKGDKDIEYLLTNCKLSQAILNTYLTMLEIRGIIKRLPGGVYSSR